MKTLRLGILGSTRGTDMQALIDAIEAKKLAATIEVVVSNKKQAGILERARNHNLNHYCLESVNIMRSEYDDLLSHIFQQCAVDLIILIGYMRVLSSEFVSFWKNKIINVHPSLLPEFAGGMNKSVHQAVLTSGKTETGCTVHYVTEKVDEGPILLQKKCAVYPNDSVESLQERVQQLEGQALIEVINQWSKE